MVEKRAIGNDWDEFIAFLENNQKEYLASLKESEDAPEQDPDVPKNTLKKK